MSQARSLSPRPEPGSSPLAKAAGDASIIAIFVVIAIILIVTVSITLIVRYLRGVVDDATARALAAVPTAWLAARQRALTGPAAPLA